MELVGVNDWVILKEVEKPAENSGFIIDEEENDIAEYVVKSTNDKQLLNETVLVLKSNTMPYKDYIITRTDGVIAIVKE